MEGAFGHDENLDNLFVAMQRNVNHQVPSSSVRAVISADKCDHVTLLLPLEVHQYGLRR